MESSGKRNEEMEIDDSLYSRQRYVLGDTAMQKMARASVFLSGMGGLGVEIAKNVILAGVKAVTVHDVGAASLLDLSSQFYLSEEHVAMAANRAEASLALLRQLNPYVTVTASTHPLDTTSDLSFLSDYQCVVVADASLALQLRLDQFCRSARPPIKFISCSVRGVFCSLFCDFGPEFVVMDTNGEELVECFIGSITKGCPGVVTSLEGAKHGLEDGDKVEFREVVGMATLNGTTHTVKVLSPTQFSIQDTSGASFEPYKHGGIARQCKLSKKMAFQSLEQQLPCPDFLIADLGKMEGPLQMHLAFLALDRFIAERSSLPKPRDETDAHLLVDFAKQTNDKYKLVECVDEALIQQFSWTSLGLLPPLATTLGGIAAQEVLISLTGKFSPLHQWMFLDAVELLAGQEAIDHTHFLPCGDRYDALRVCLGEGLLQRLASLKLFMVGCGAIGCEMLKNYAMLGVARKPAGLLTITDNDIIEKSNLNRQFLFRPHHIQRPKSLIASRATLELNPDLQIEAQQFKVFPGTEEKVYPDSFFLGLDLVVNALDNVEARRYVDSRCVSNQRPLLESGTMGPKGHVQVVVPHLTESYSSQQDPPDKDVPYCTLKSFPASIEHTIQWARDKFESQFTQKPSMYNKFWQTHGSPENVIQSLQRQLLPDGVVQVVKALQRRPTCWQDCLHAARLRFERYFNHKACNLIHAFPLDTKMKDGSLFWQLPKRPPVPLSFDPTNTTHIMFVTSLARLYAAVWGMGCSSQDLAPEEISRVVAATKVPEFRPSSKRIETDESAKKPQMEDITEEVVEGCQRKLTEMVHSGSVRPEQLTMFPLSFEKDDDSNGHIEFITAASNLRASMYSIESVDRFKTKLIAGRIIPAIATTTAAVAGLASIELVKVVMKLPLESFKNSFLNLALPSLLFSEPAPPIRTVISAEHSFTLWDYWEVRGCKPFTLKDFIHAVKSSYGLEPAMVVQGVKMVYVPLMPGHRKRLPKLMMELLRIPSRQEYVDLTVSFESDQGEDIPGPPIRYYHK